MSRSTSSLTDEADARRSPRLTSVGASVGASAPASTTAPRFRVVITVARWTASPVITSQMPRRPSVALKMRWVSRDGGSDGVSRDVSSWAREGWAMLSA